MRVPPAAVRLLVASLPAVCWLPGQAPAELPGVRAATQAMVDHLQLRGAGLVVVRADAELHRCVHGNLLPDTVLPIASASKWLAVATVLTLVDEEKLDLDVPVARYVKEFDRDDKRMITLRQCLAHTSGLPARLRERMDGWDMAKFAAEAADAGLPEQPRSAFRYGGVGIQVAAVAAERASGRTWHQLFAERIAGPLGMKATKFGTLIPPGDDAGTAALPWAAGGAVSTLDDYSRFVRMLAGNGRIDGTRVLSDASVAMMWRDQVADNVEVRAVGFDGDRMRYGLGTWIQTLDDGVVRVTDPGAFGFTPWLDLDLGVGGVFAVRDRAQRILGHLPAVIAEVRASLRSPAVAGTAKSVELEHGGRERRYELHVPPHEINHPGLPLLLVLHGGGGSGEQVRDNTGLAEAGMRAGFVVAFPDGTGPLRGKLLTWNSGSLAVYASEHQVDDVGFLRAVVMDVRKRVPIDASRVFATGHSNGAMMCHRLARQAADVFAGIAPVEGAINFTAGGAASPIAVLIVHGTADDHVRYDGGAPRASAGRAGERVDPSVQDAVDYYVERNGLVATPDTRQDGKVRIDTYAVGVEGADAPPVRVITLDGGGHAWPGAKGRTRLLADTPFPFDASAAIVEFFAQLPRGRVTTPPAPAEPAAPR